MTIDSIDIKDFGCTILEGSLDSLLKYPKRSTVEFNDWAETNGIEPDLTKVEFDSKNVDITFLMESENIDQFYERYKNLISFLSAPGYRVFNLISGMVHNMRFNQNSNYDIIEPLNVDENHSSFVLGFIQDDFSFTGVRDGSINISGLFSINGIDFSEFGIGSDDDQNDILKYPAMKSPFTDGHTYDLSTMKMQSKTIKIDLWMLANNVNEFVNNYSAFFNEMTKTGTFSLYVGSLNGSVNAYYSDCTSFKVDSWNSDFIATRFTLSLVIPVVTWIDGGGSTIYRVLMDSDSGKLLANEDNKILVFN